MDTIKKTLSWLGDHLMLVAITVIGILGFVVKMLLNKNAGLKAENVAIEEKGKLEELKNEDKKQTEATNSAVKSYEQLRNEYLRKR